MPTKFIKNILLSALFLTLCLAALLLTIIHNDATLKNIANFFLKKNSLEITQLIEVDVSLTQLAISFQKIELKYKNHFASIEELSIYLGDISKNRPYHEVSINKALFVLSHENFSNNNKENKSIDNLHLHLSDYLPAKLIQDYAGVDFRINSLFINHATLKNPVIFKDVKLVNSPTNLKMTLSSELLNYQPKLLIAIDSKNKLNIEITFSKNDFITLNLTADSHNTSAEENTGNIESIGIKGDLDLQLSNAFKQFINQHFIDSANIHSIKSTIKLSWETSIPSYISVVEDLYPSLFSGKLHGNTLSHLQFNNLLIDTISANLNFIAKPHTSESTEVKTQYSHTVQFLKHNTLQVNLNAKHEMFQNNKSSQFLANQEILVDIKPETEMILEDNAVVFDKGLVLNWAKKTDPAFVNWELNSFNANYASKENFKINLGYHLNGRWNRFFATQHKANIKVRTTNSGLKAEVAISDKDLQSELDISLEKNNQTITSKYHYKLGKLKQNNKKLNKIISYWDKDLKILSGSADLNGDLTAKLDKNNQLSNVVYHFNLDLNDFNLDYDDFIFSTLNSEIIFSGNNKHVTNITPSIISIKHIDAGLALKDLTLNALYDFNLDGDSKIYFTKLQAQTLGGQLSSEEMTFFLPFAQENQKQSYHANFLVKLDNLELSKVLELADNPEIEGDGLLYGELPIYIDEVSTLIKSGWLKNKNAGTLQYRPNEESRAMLKQNPQMKLLLEVLGHLDYQQLRADIELDNSGIMTIQGHTQGVNPDFINGYPIIFNPRIELNIQDMIRSLQISDEIGNKVSNRIQEKNLD